MTGKTLTAGRDVDAISDFDGADPSAEAAARSARIARLKPFQFRPGQSGCPGGGAGEFARRVRAAVRDGRDLIDFLVAVMRDERERTRDRLAAAAELANRGWGRPPAFVAVQRYEQQRERPARSFPNLERMSIDQVRTLLHLLKIARGESVPAAPGPKGIPEPGE
jgi:hypothetical protein